MEKRQALSTIADKLWDNSCEENWAEFAGALKGSGAKYYRVVFGNKGKLNKVQELTKSYAEIYDAKYKQIAKVPIFKTVGKKIEGATIYMKGLEVSNR